MENPTASAEPVVGPSLARPDRDSNDVCARQGMGQRIGFGQRPAVLLIDMQSDFCDADAPTTVFPCQMILQANLFDVDQTYGDVVTLDICLSYIANLPAVAGR